MEDLRQRFEINVVLRLKQSLKYIILYNRSYKIYFSLIVLEYNNIHSGLITLR